MTRCFPTKLGWRATRLAFAALTLLVCGTGWLSSNACAAPPVLNTVFPPGGTAGQTIELIFTGSGFGPGQALLSSCPFGRVEALEPGRFRVELPGDTPPGFYDLWLRGPDGVSNVRTFVVGALPEQTEPTPSGEIPDNQAPATATPAALDLVINGRFERAADVDWFRFSAKQGQRVVLEVASERIDSVARPVLELFDAQQRRLAVSRGYFGTDPLIECLLPTAGDYWVKLSELVSAGGPEHYYRLSIDTRPRVVAVYPPFISRTESKAVTLLGWNLSATTAPPSDTLPNAAADAAIGSGLEQVQFPDRQLGASTGLESLRFTPPAVSSSGVSSLGVSRFPPARWQPAQAGLIAAAGLWTLPGSSTPVVPLWVEEPVVLDEGGNNSASTAQSLTLPALVAGQLARPDEQDYYSFTAQRGEAWYFEAFGQRLGAPVDLRLALLTQASAEPGAPWVEQLQLGDQLRETGDAFPLGHLDPSGRWVCPASGRYVLSVANLAATTRADQRRIYALRLHREEPGLQLVALPRGSVAGAINSERDGRFPVELLLTRQPGTTQPVRVTPRQLPAGVEFPEVWLGTEIERGVGVLTLTPAYDGQPFDLELEATLAAGGQTLTVPVIPGAVVRPGRPRGWGRLVSRCPVALVGQARAQLHVSAHEPLEHHLYGRLPVRHSPGGIVDFAIEVDRFGVTHAATTRLSFDGLPPQFQAQTAVLAPGQNKGALALLLPPTLPVGPYSFVIKAETTVPNDGAQAAPVTLYSTPVTVQVEPAAFRLEIDPFAVTRVKRNQVVTVAYKARRLGGFIGKLHTELAVPGQITDVPGLRGRGETFVGQTDSGSLQIAVNADAPLGPVPFLRLLTIGVVEDEALFQGSQFLPLEIVE